MKNNNNEYPVTYSIEYFVERGRHFDAPTLHKLEHTGTLNGFMDKLKKLMESQCSQDATSQYCSIVLCPAYRISYSSNWFDHTAFFKVLSKKTLDRLYAYNSDDFYLGKTDRLHKTL